MPVRIMVVDDHPVVRDGLVAMLATQPDFEIVAEAASGRDAVRLAASSRPDVMLLDLEMPDMDGVETLRQLAAAHQAVRVLVFTAFDTDERILGALRAGAQGYLLKGAPRAELFNAIWVIQAGGSLLQPVVASRLLRHVSAKEEPDQPEPLPLTPREQEILGLLAQGLRNNQIAGRLTISERTVKFHVSSILGKLDAGNRTEAVKMAALRGLVKF